MLKYGPMRTVVERLGYYMPSGRTRVKLECGHLATTHNAGIRKSHCPECLQEEMQGKSRSLVAPEKMQGSLGMTR